MGTPGEKLVTLTVRLTPAQLAALSHVAVVVTAAADAAVINAAEAGLRCIREAAAKHPALPEHLKRGSST